MTAIVEIYLDLHRFKIPTSQSASPLFLMQSLILPMMTECPDLTQSPGLSPHWKLFCSVVYSMATLAAYTHRSALE